MPSFITRLSLTIAVVLFIHIAPAQTQQFSITAGTINTCGGVMEDSGGPSAPYGNNENFTVVICPDNPGDAISLNWVVFNLSQQLPQPIDRIKIWDGNTTTAPFLGEYTGTALQGLITSATIYNISGCLTVQFTSNGGGVGDFAAGITCYTPCERPTAVATMSEPGPPARVCVGEPILFDGSGSYAAAGFTLAQYNWDFHDGSTATTDTVTHSFSAPGEYMVQLHLVDDNGCVNSNMVDLQVLVGTTPSFAGTTANVETCLGATVDLAAVATPTTWTGVHEANFGDGVYLPDDLGIPFTSDLVFTQFDAGQTLTNLGDLLSVCASMEHSFMGDLVIQLACPSGQSVIMHQQGGGGTFIGAANDLDNSTNPVIGQCWQYCWSPTATLGTFANCASSGPTPHVITGGTPPSAALEPGTYSSVQPFSNLLGCPLNGTWTFTITDLWAADNGFLCDWSLNFNPSIIPDATQFTPVLNANPDSAGWTGPAITANPANPYLAQATPTGSGSFGYTFHVTDNFGCTYDTTITVTVAPQMQVDAGPALTLCNDSLPMAGAITANGPATGCNWTIILSDLYDDGWNGNASITVTINGASTNYTSVAGNGSQQTVTIPVTNGGSMSVFYTPGSVFNNENSFKIQDSQGTVVYASPMGPQGGVLWSGTTMCTGAPPVTYAWTPATGLANPASPTSLVWVDAPTWYQLAVFPNGHPECAVMDSVLVAPAPGLDPGENGTALVCESSPMFLMADSLGGTPAPGGAWSLGLNAAPNQFTPSDHSPGTYLFAYTITTAGGCSATSTLEVTVLPDTNPICCGTPDAGPDAYSCNLSIQLAATPGNTGVGQWYGPPGAVFANAQDPHTTVSVPPGSGGAHWFYWREIDGVYCNTVDSVRITFTDAIMISLSTVNATCFSYCDGTAQATVTGGNAANGFTYAWSIGTVGSIPSAVSGLCAGAVELTVTDDNGCTASKDTTITQPVLLQIDATSTVPVTCSGDCDGQVTVQDGEAVDYSFNAGALWGPSNTLTGACEGNYQLMIRDAAGCIGTGSVAVTGPPPVEANFIWGPVPATVNDPTIHFHNTSTGAETYLWDIAGQASSTAYDTVYIFTNKVPGIYRVCLSAYNYNQCADTICNDVEIMDVLEPYVPNAFTPDGDGRNDLFFMSVNIRTITSFEMLIYDRWGQLMFRTTDPYEPWQGRKDNSGEVLPTGVYVYRIRYEVAKLQTRRELRGHVTLLK